MNSTHTDTYTILCDEMIKQLRANAHKGDNWKEMTPKQLCLELYYHVGKLQSALHRGESQQVKEFSADISNLSMMVMDKYNLLK